MLFGEIPCNSFLQLFIVNMLLNKITLFVSFKYKVQTMLDTSDFSVPNLHKKLYNYLSHMIMFVSLSNE